MNYIEKYTNDSKCYKINNKNIKSLNILIYRILNSIESKNKKFTINIYFKVDIKNKFDIKNLKVYIYKLLYNINNKNYDIKFLEINIINEYDNYTFDNNSNNLIIKFEYYYNNFFINLIDDRYYFLLISCYLNNYYYYYNCKFDVDIVLKLTKEKKYTNICNYNFPLVKYYVSNTLNILSKNNNQIQNNENYVDLLFIFDKCFKHFYNCSNINISCFNFEFINSYSSTNDLLETDNINEIMEYLSFNDTNMLKHSVHNIYNIENIIEFCSYLHNMNSKYNNLINTSKYLLSNKIKFIVNNMNLKSSNLNFMNLRFTIILICFINIIINSNCCFPIINITLNEFNKKINYDKLINNIKYELNKINKKAIVSLVINYSLIYNNDNIESDSKSKETFAKYYICNVPNYNSFYNLIYSIYKAFYLKEIKMLGNKYIYNIIKLKKIFKKPVLLKIAMFCVRYSTDVKKQSYNVNNIKSTNNYIQYSIVKNESCFYNEFTNSIDTLNDIQNVCYTKNYYPI